MTAVHPAMPVVTFGEDTDYDTLISLLKGWVVEIESAGFVIQGSFQDETTFLRWDEETLTASIPVPVVIETIERITVI